MAFVNLPPNFQDIFAKIDDRLSKLETGPNQPLYVAESAQATAMSAQGSSAQALAEAEAAAAEAAAANATAAAAQTTATAAAAAAGTAQTQAASALAEATLAYNKAVGSLQPSASTIVNASNQMTAISTNGITVYSGNQSNMGARVVMNSAGIAGFNSSSTGPNNGSTFSIDSSTGAAVFKGSVTGATITGSDLNINGVFIVNGTTGVMTATNATVQGTINALSGYFGTQANGWSIGSNGLSGVGTGTITGGVISGTTFTNGSTFSVTSGGVLTASSGTIGGVTIGSSTLTGGTIQTSSGNDAVVLSGSNNALGIKYGGTFAGWLVGIGSGQFMMHYGTTPSVTGYPRHAVSSTTASMAADGSNSLSITTSGSNMQGNITFGGTTNTFTNSVVLNGTVTYPGATTASGSTLVLVGTGSRVGYVSSSRKTKKNIEPLVGTYVDKVNALQPVSFDWLEQPEDMPYRKNYGFIAEDTYEIPEIESVVNLNENGEPITISYDRLAPFFAKALQELDARLKTLEGN